MASTEGHFDIVKALVDSGTELTPVERKESEVKVKLLFILKLPKFINNPCIEKD